MESCLSQDVCGIKTLEPSREFCTAASYSTRFCGASRFPMTTHLAEYLPDAQLSTFVQTAASAEQLRGSKQIVTQRLSTQTTAHLYTSTDALSHIRAVQGASFVKISRDLPASARPSFSSGSHGQQACPTATHAARILASTYPSTASSASLRALQDSPGGQQKTILGTQLQPKHQKELDEKPLSSATGSHPELAGLIDEKSVLHRQTQQQQHLQKQQIKLSCAQRENTEEVQPCLPRPTQKDGTEGSDDEKEQKAFAAETQSTTTTSAETASKSDIADLKTLDLTERTETPVTECLESETLASNESCSPFVPCVGFSPLPDVPTEPENTLIILDYDDTILPTNWAAVQNRVALNDPLPAELLPSLAELSDLAIQTIDACLRTAMVVIVTNASVEWVNRSGEKFIPSVLGYIEKQGIQIISARDRLQNTGLPQRQWKIRIFEDLITDVFGERMRDGSECSVVSIGDGEGEREACLEMCRNLGINEWLFKSLKLLAQPTCNQLISEHVLIQKAFPDILKVRQSLDMAILDYKNSRAGHNGIISQDSPCSLVRPETPNVETDEYIVPSTVIDAKSKANQKAPVASKPLNGSCSMPVSKSKGLNNENVTSRKGSIISAAACNGQCASLLPRISNFDSFNDEPLPPNTDAFIDLISNQLKAEHEQPTGSEVASASILARNSSNCAKGTAQGSILESTRLLLA